MRATTAPAQPTLVRLVAARPALLALLLLALAAAALPIDATTAAGRPRLTAAYDRGDGRGPRPDATLTIRGARFPASGGNIELTVKVLDTGGGGVHDETLLVRTTKRGGFVVVFEIQEGACPCHAKVEAVYATGRVIVHIEAH